MDCSNLSIKSAERHTSGHLLKSGSDENAVRVDDGNTKAVKESSFRPSLVVTAVY